MDANNSLWNMYDKSRLKHNPAYIDPLYLPYVQEEQEVVFHTGRKGKIMMNSWKKQGPGVSVHPALERKGWGMSFQRKHPSDPCPLGFTPGESGWCFEEEPENEPLFYTKDAYLPVNYFARGSMKPTNPERSNYGRCDGTSRKSRVESGDMLLF